MIHQNDDSEKEKGVLLWEGAADPDPELFALTPSGIPSSLGRWFRVVARIQMSESLRTVTHAHGRRLFRGGWGPRQQAACLCKRVRSDVLVRG